MVTQLVLFTCTSENFQINSMLKTRYLCYPLKNRQPVFFHFFSKMSLELRSHLMNSVNKTIRFCKLKEVFWTQRKLNTLSRKKNRLKMQILKSIVIVVFT